MSRRSDERIVYRLRKPWPNPQGATCLVLEPGDFLRRLAALVPAPYTNLVRYHGVFAGRSRWRKLLPAPPANVARGHAETPANSDHNLALFEDRPNQTNAATTDGSHHEAASAASVPAANAAPHTPPPESPTRNRRRSIPWAQLLMRVFERRSKCT